MAMDGAYAEAPAFGRQVYRCGKPVLGMHLIRQFHASWQEMFLQPGVERVKA